MFKLNIESIKSKVENELAKKQKYERLSTQIQLEQEEIIKLYYDVQNGKDITWVENLFKDMIISYIEQLQDDLKAKVHFCEMEEIINTFLPSIGIRVTTYYQGN